VRTRRRARTNYIITVCFLCNIHYKYIFISHYLKIMLQKSILLFSFIFGGLTILKLHYVQFWQPLLSSGQSSWLQIQRPGFNSRRYQIFWEVVGLERGPLSLVSTIEVVLERKCSGSGLESREYGRMYPSCWPCGTLYLQKLTQTSPTSGGRSVGIVRSRTQTTEFSSLCTLTFLCIYMRIG
jgi:hypothetical protein